MTAVTSNPVTSGPAAGPGPDVLTTTAPGAAQGDARPLWQRFALGRSEDPRWARPALLGLLVATAVFYLWDLNINGYSNDFYAAAVQAGTQSWKAFFFGSFDSSSFITVDKPPASLWPMELSGRVFGFSSWSMLVPEALEGVACVGLLYGIVRRISSSVGGGRSGHVAGLVAGGALALTPAASLMFRFNNPDAFLLLLLTSATYCVVRALQSGRTGWLLGAGWLVGTAFLAKSGQGLLALPAFGVAYLFLGPLGFWRRFVQLLAAFGMVIAGAGWWILAVELTPAADRPYVGGSTDNSELGLAFGYNGLGRLFGGDGNGGGGGTAARVGGGGGGAGGFSGTPGITRLFSGDMATEISWLLPAALLSLVAGLVITARRPRTDLTRAGFVLLGLWMLVTAVTFSFAQGTIHEYYTVALAAPVAGLAILGCALMFQTRAFLFSRVALSVTIAVTAYWDVHLLNLESTFVPAFRYLVVLGAVVAVAALLLGPYLRQLAVVAVVATVVTGALGTASYAVDNISKAHTGSIPTSGPSSRGGFGGGGGFRAGATGGGATRTRGTGDAPGAGAFPGGGALPGGTEAFAGGAPPAGALPGGAGAAGGAAPGGAGATTSSAALDTLLKDAGAKWAAAASSSMTAGPLELSSGAAVMALGGFNGSDAAITLQGFEKLVADGQVRYYIGAGQGGFGRGRGGTGDASSIASWVAANYTATTVGGTTVYDLRAAASAA